MAGVSSVLDFGGGCGLHYKQAQSPDVRDLNMRATKACKATFTY